MSVNKDVTSSMNSVQEWQQSKKVNFLSFTTQTVTYSSANKVNHHICIIKLHESLISVTILWWLVHHYFPRIFDIIFCNHHRIKKIFYPFKDEIRANTEDWSALGMHGNMSGPLVIEGKFNVDRMVGPPGDGRIVSNVIMNRPTYLNAYLEGFSS